MLIFYLLQGFDDVALTPGKATMVIHHFENRTGHTVSMSDFLKGRLCPEDYNIKQQVCTDFFCTSNETTPGCPFQEDSPIHLPQE